MIAPFRVESLSNKLSYMRFFWGAGQKLQKSLTSKLIKNHVCEFLFMIAPFRVGSLVNKLSDMNTMESRFLEPSVSWTSWYLEPNLVSIEFASLKLYNFTPDFSNPRFLDTPDDSNQFWLPLDKLILDNSNLETFLNHLVRMSITFTLIRWLYILFSKVWISHVNKYFFPLVNVGKSQSTRLKVNNKNPQCKTTYRRLFHNVNVVALGTTNRDACLSDL